MAIPAVLKFVREHNYQLVSPEILGLPPVSEHAADGLARSAPRLVEALLAGDELLARQIVFELYLAKHSRSAIFDEVIATAFREIGDRWACQDADIYQERRGCEIALRVLFDLRRLQETPEMRWLATGGTIEGDPYTLPSAMAELVLRDCGFYVTSLGASIPMASLIKAIQEMKPNLFWLSVSHIREGSDFISEFAALSDACVAVGTALAVGGRALTADLRQRMTYSAYCDTMQHLEAFATTLHRSLNGEHNAPRNAGLRSPAVRKAAAEAEPKPSNSQPRLGLCCHFVEHPIKFRMTTASSLQPASREEQLRKLSGLCLANAESLLAALDYCAEHDIGCFRINSQILPVKTHPQVGYSVEELPDTETITAAFRRCGEFAAKHALRTVFHPDQFVVLNSPREEVVDKSIQELEYQAEVADWVGADVINVHGGGAYGDKAGALEALVRNIDRLSDAVRSRLTIENDDKVYTPSDLLPFCRAAGLPLVYDVHHHRCLPDGLSVEQVTEAALGTWDREPLFHISSPLDGRNGARPQRHHDYIDPNDFPDAWRGLAVTIEVEAKAKELAVLRLQKALRRPKAARSRRQAGRRASR